MVRFNRSMNDVFNVEDSSELLSASSNRHAAPCSALRSTLMMRFDFLPVPPLGPAVILQSSVGGRRELIDLGGQDEVAFRQAIDLVSPDRESNHTPCQVDIWVVSLGFSQHSDSVGECEGLPEVFESKLSLQMMLFNGSPVATELPLESL